MIRDMPVVPSGDAMKPVGASADDQWKASGTAPSEGDGAAHSDNPLFRHTEALYRAQGLSEIYEAALDADLRRPGLHACIDPALGAAGVMRFTAWRGLSEGYRAAVEGSFALAG